MVEWKLKGRIRKNPTDEVSRPEPARLLPLHLPDHQQQSTKCATTWASLPSDIDNDCNAIGFPRRRTSLPLALVPRLLDALKSYRCFQNLENFNNITGASSCDGFVLAK